MKCLKIFLVAIVFALSARANAVVEVGATPELNVPAIGGGFVKLSDARGKYVLVHFWSARGAMNVDDLSNLVSLHAKYAPKGLLMLGVACDPSPAQAQQVVKDKGLNWPQHVDTSSQARKNWGITSVPRAFLIDPSGKVIWIGSTGPQLDKKLDSLLGKSSVAPTSNPSAIDAKTILDQAQASLDHNSLADAAKNLAMISPFAQKDAETAARATQLQDRLNAAADAALAAAVEQITGQHFAEAASQLKNLAQTIPNSPQAASARQKLADLSKDPEAQKQLELSEQTDHAAVALAAAQKMQADKHDDAAYIAFKAVATKFPQTDSAATAQQAIEAYEADPAFMKHQSEKQSRTPSAKSMLSLAESYLRSGAKSSAMKKYREVIDNFPGSTEAETAKASLEKLQM